MAWDRRAPSSGQSQDLPRKTASLAAFSTTNTRGTAPATANLVQTQTLFVCKIGRRSRFASRLIFRAQNMWKRRVQFDTNSRPRSHLQRGVRRHPGYTRTHVPWESDRDGRGVARATFLCPPTHTAETLSPRAARAGLQLASNTGPVFMANIERDWKYNLEGTTHQLRQNVPTVTSHPL